MIINQILVKQGWDGTIPLEQPEPIKTAEYKIRWLDYDGTVLKVEWVNSGNNATPPDDPVHDNLTFQGWNISHLNIQQDLDIGATYITTDGKTHLYVTVNSVTSLNVLLYLNKSNSSTLSVDWGDGSAVSTFTNSGNFNTGTKTYASAGDYVIKMWISSGVGTYGFGNGTNFTVCVGGSTQVRRNTLTRLHIGANVTTIGANAFFQCFSLMSMTLPTNITTIGNNAFQVCHNLKALILPSNCSSIATVVWNANYNLKNVSIPFSVTTLPTSMFNACFNLSYITIPSSVTAIGVNLFFNGWSFKSITIPAGVTSIGTSAFSGLYTNLEYIFLRTTPPTLASTNSLAGISVISKIYVPDDSVAAYKSATNWSTYANYIYALSTR